MFCYLLNCYSRFQCRRVQESVVGRSSIRSFVGERVKGNMTFNITKRGKSKMMMKNLPDTYQQDYRMESRMRQQTFYQFLKRICQRRNICLTPTPFA